MLLLTLPLSLLTLLSVVICFVLLSLLSFGVYVAITAVGAACCWMLLNVVVGVAVVVHVGVGAVAVFVWWGVSTVSS